MPIRLLREGILSSDRIETLDWPAEVFYRRLMSKVDDYGLFDARPSILRSSLYPLRVDRVREADIARWIAACETAGVIALYVHGGKPFGQMLDTGWQTRSEPKHPLPPWGKGEPPRTGENSCEQPGTVAHVFGVVVVDEDVVRLRRAGDGFDEFYAAYPRKVKSKDALKAWEKIKPTPELRAVILAAIESQKLSQQWQKDGGQFIPYPATWLNAEEWKNEMTVRLPDPASVAADETKAMLDAQRDRGAVPPPENIREQLRAGKVTA